MLDRIGIGSTYTTCQQDPVTDSRKVQHSPIGKVILRWHKNEAAKSYSEPFYVVDSQSLLVILGETAFRNIDQSSGDFFGPTGVQPQTADEKLALNQKKLQVSQRRDQEKKEQEGREAEQRRQADKKT
ncbi:MAG: hypothetical protein LQ339_007856 [Xanthoria mediterranea]|nr:MAG: hypothetical protein LQ339_007856 [Xanthoria mediterranea]